MLMKNYYICNFHSQFFFVYFSGEQVNIVTYEILRIYDHIHALHNAVNSGKVHNIAGNFLCQVGAFIINFRLNLM